MESSADTNNENNSSMLNISDKNYLNKSFNKYLPEKPDENRNQRAKIDNKTHNYTKDTKNNGTSNINSTFQKTFSLFNESNYDSNSQTDRSSKNLKEIKVNISSKQRKNNTIKNQTQNLSYNENIINDIQPINMVYLSEDKLSKIILIQKWWKKYYKIIFIQKYLRGFLLRKNMAKIIYFIKSIFKIIFKLIIDNIKKDIQMKNNNNIYNTELKKNYNKNKKVVNSNKLPNNIKLNYHPSFNASNKICLNKELKKVNNKNIKKDNFQKFGNNNPINVNLVNNSNKFLNKNKNNKIFKKNNKNLKEKEINNISNKDKLIANNIFNIYNNVKKYYENSNNNNSNHNNNFIDSNYSTANNFFNKNKKNSLVNKTNKSKNKNLKKMITRGSMKNLNENIIINKNNNINVNININNNPKTDRINREKDNSNKNEINSILYLLKLKKVFLFWNSFIIKKKILQKLKNIKNINTPFNSKKALPIFTIKDKGKEKTISIKAKKINISNSLISIKLDKITPQKLKMKNDNKIKNKVINNYTKKINKHSISVENNNSMINLDPPKSVLNSSFNLDKNIKMQSHKNSQCSNNIFNNSVIVVSQYDRNNEIKNKSEKNNKNNNINETKKIYYFYAIINLIDKHNKRKIIKKYFYIWKSMIKFSRSFINSCGIEEKIISFKNIKSPLKNNLNNKNNNALFSNNSSGNFNCQTEEGREPRFGHGKSNTMINHQDLLTPNPLEKVNHPNLFKSNIKSSQIVYQKKLLVQKKMRNQSMKSIYINNGEEDRNMTLTNNNHDMNFYKQFIGNNFYNLNTFMNNNDLNNSQFFNRRNNFENNIGKKQEDRIKGIKGIEETEIFFNQNQAYTMKNSFIVGKNNSNEEEGFNSNKINVNVVENYRKLDMKKNENNNNRYMNNNDNNGITTKQIILGDKNKRFKNYSHSQEFRNNNQSF